MQPRSSLSAPVCHSLNESVCGCITHHFRTESKPNHRCIIVIEWDNILFPTNIMEKMLNQILHKSKKNRKQTLSVNKHEYQQLYNLSFVTYNTLLQYVIKYSAKNITIITTSPVQWISNTLQLFKSIGYFNNIYDALFKNSEIKIIHPKVSCLPFKSKKDLMKYKEIALAKVCCDPCINLNSESINSMVCLGDDLYKIAVKQTINILTIYIHFVHKIKLKQFSRPKDMMEQLRFLQVFYNEVRFDYFSRHYREIDIDYRLYKLINDLRNRAKIKII